MQPSNAKLSINITFSDILIDVSEMQCWNALSSIDLIFFDRFILIRLVQFANILAPISIVLSGILIDESEKQQEKADEPIDVIVFGI